ncbi:alpha/beta hydrolase family protein [Rubinisphaera margarita]|uniref:alpha/beta hydrolase family protein n=1 Tax=Rubinisphaera margarita TaxID=2909586 RepID=UPI001EE8919F|nr:acetylxylan esterase [Rubinisphaera margarita]MCG6156477.1 acetylxylan esterase [Rubinisphaera margarita]
MTKPLLFVLSIFATCLAASLTASAGDFAEQRQRVLELGEIGAVPQVHPAEGFEGTERVRAIFYDALPWQGKETRVFAWLGMPEDTSKKVPGIVLVHGGGGTAYREWVEKWNAHGFAAISIDVEGQTDVPMNPGRRGSRWEQHEWPGPQRLGIFSDADQPLADQWIYHAVADAVLARNLLQSLPEVNGDQIGLAGISWGGVVTSTVIGIDSRFAFAIPIYGCGRLFNAGNHWGAALGPNQQYRQVWDPMVRMDRVKMPVLWLSWPLDNHFPLDAQAACYRSAPGPRMVSLIPGMGHSHPAGWNPPDSYAFAKAVVKDEAPWIRQTETAQNGNRVTVGFQTSRSLSSAVLVSTTDTGFTGNREWKQTPAQLKQSGQNWTASAELPDGTSGWFINVKSDDLTASSDYVEPTSN